MLAPLGTLLGGLGLFLLGMWLMTDGLKVAAGRSLRAVLARWTRTRGHGLAAGFIVTALVQSSSAVTVAAIGFVNAGLLNLNQAIWVLFGSNVGTTMTGWLVSLIGFNFKIEAIAVPLLGLGMVLRLTGPGSRRGAIGEALAGFGLFFMGIGILRDAFAGLSGQFDLTAFTTAGPLEGAAFVLVGFVVTLLTQSSSASLALALTAAAGGLLPLEPAAAMVVGANLGTTSTGLLAVIGATANARRVALGHVIFNLITAVVAVLLLPWVVGSTEWLRQAVDLPEGPATVLALFHTLFNLLGVAIMWPIADRLVHWLSRRFVTAEEDEARPRHLDATLVAVPALAIDALGQELDRLSAMSLKFSLAVLGGRDTRRLPQRRIAIEQLGTAIAGYVHRLYGSKLPAPVADALVHPLRAVLLYAELAEIGQRLRSRLALIDELPAALQHDVHGYRDEVADALAEELKAKGRMPSSTRKGWLDEIEHGYQELKTELLQTASQGTIPVGVLDHAVELAGDLRQLGLKSLKAGRRTEAMLKAAASLEVDEQLLALAEGEAVFAHNQLPSPAKPPAGAERSSAGTAAPGPSAEHR